MLTSYLELFGLTSEKKDVAVAHDVTKQEWRVFNRRLILILILLDYVYSLAIIIRTNLSFKDTENSL